MKHCIKAYKKTVVVSHAFDLRDPILGRSNCEKKPASRRLKVNPCAKLRLKTQFAGLEM